VQNAEREGFPDPAGFFSSLYQHAMTAGFPFGGTGFSSREALLRNYTNSE
jgi:hypothetical protein